MKNLTYFIFGGTVLIAYFIILQWVDIEFLSTLFVTSATIIGGLAIWIQLKREKDLKEAEFIVNYNNTFITNEKFTDVESKLERYKKIIGTEQVTKKPSPELKKAIQDIEEIDTQSLINYLVYLEALSTLVTSGVVRLRNIDNLLSYRFFLAVNNSVVQSLELIPDSTDYRGTYILHQKWTKYKSKNNLKILLKSTSLSETREYNKILGIKDKKTK